MKTPAIFAPAADAFTSALGRPATIRDAAGQNPATVDAILRMRNEEAVFTGDGGGAMATRSRVSFATEAAPSAEDGWTIEDSADGAVYTMHDLADDGRGMTTATLRRQVP